MKREQDMSIGLVGKKCGMSRIFTEQGESIPVTLIEATPNRVTLVKTDDTDGYSAVQVTAGTRRAALLNKPQKGHYAKAKVEAGRGLWEFRVRTEDAGNYEVGGEIAAGDVFEVGQTVDVAGVSKGKGFAGAIKRHHFRGQDNTHGNSLSHRAPGSIGQNQTPGRVFPGKKMAGQMGAVKRTQQGLEIVRVDAERHLIAVKGAVPGATGGDVIIRPTTKGS
jgi:large subunit ribosomal protein L3